MKVLYFAWMRERTGVSEEVVESEAATVADLARELAGRDDAHAAAFADLKAVRVAVDRKVADWETPLAGAGEVAFFPPMTGG
ncbi:MAG: molybdopterin converting factor subunit 1 [Pseudomonadota bacterium]